MTNILLYFFGFLPSIAWLAYYLNKDKHPESNKAVLKVFGLGMLSGFWAIFLKESAYWIVRGLALEPLIESLPSGIFIILLGEALIEETVKYAAVRISMFNSPELDESVDIIIYMIIAGLGFAALENILFLISEFYPLITPVQTVQAITARFLSATFLHTLSSGTLGYFLILSFSHLKKKRLLFFLGLAIATLLHGTYNFAIIRLENPLRILSVLSILIGTSIFLSYGFKKAKRSKPLCNLK